MNLLEPSSRLWVCCLVILIWSPVVGAGSTNGSAPPDELYQRAVERHLQFEDQKAIKILKRLLEHNPHHQKARDLLQEMGVTPPPSERDDRAADERDPNTSDPRRTSPSDTAPAPPEGSTSGPSSAGPDPDPGVEADTAGEPGRHNPVEKTTEPGTSTKPASPELTPLEDTASSPEGRANTPNEPSPDDSSDLPSFRGLSSDSKQNGGGEGPRASAESDRETRIPNLNTVDHQRLSQLIGAESADRILGSISDQGYYMNWEDLAQRHDLPEERLRELRNRYRIEVPVLNVNTSTVEELSRLPYIDRVLARNIVNFRFTYGPYTYVGELLDVPGFTESILNNVRAYLTLR